VEQATFANLESGEGVAPPFSVIKLRIYAINMPACWTPGHAGPRVIQKNTPETPVYIYPAASEEQLSHAMDMMHDT
jgi:hypothetical protein